jgi:hypothetical protein
MNAVLVERKSPRECIASIALGQNLNTANKAQSESCRFVVMSGSLV